MQSRGRAAVLRGIGAAAVTVALSLLAHLGLRELLVVGFPITYTRAGGGGVWVLGTLWRVTGHACVALLQVTAWRIITGRPRPSWAWILPATGVPALYWFVLDPGTLFEVLSPEATKAWLQWTWRRPFLSDLYWYWGYTVYQWHLVAVQGLLVAFMLALASAVKTPKEARVRAGAAEQGVAPDERRRPPDAARR
jgi:hypothetical protein